MDQGIDQTGKLWAIISYGGLLIGWPLAIVPLALRDDRYAMHHARQALGVWVVALVVGVPAYVKPGLGRGPDRLP